MRHRSGKSKLGRTRAPRRALLRNLVRSLFIHERIQTTLPKAKEARRYAERLVRFSLLGTLAARRHAGRFITDREVLRKLFNDIGPRFTGRAGGYTRIYRLGPREGDAAEMALLELVVREDSQKDKRAKEKARKSSGRKSKKAAAEKKPDKKKSRTKKQ